MATTEGPYQSEANLVEHTTETRRSTATSEFYVWIVTSVALLYFTYESGRDSLARDEDGGTSPSPTC